MRKWVLLVVVGLAGAACTNLGKENVLFVTRTNVAIDLDLQPATTSIGYKRDEFMLAPIDPEGRVLPVLTTVGVKAGVFRFGANHSFATGDASLLLGRYLLEDTQLDQEASIDFDDLEKAIVDGLPGNEIGNANRQRYLFTTNSSLGLEVTWSQEQIPTALSLGYKRKEFAFVPISKDRTDGSMSHLASLLATAHAGSTVGGPNDTRVTVGQTYATGFAATLMATHPEVRRAVGPSIVPNFGEAVEAERELARAEAHGQRLGDQHGLAGEIAVKFDAADAAGKQAIIDSAIDLGLVDAGTTPANFKGRLGLAIDAADPGTTEKFNALRDAR